MRKKKLTAAHVWAMFAETDKKFAETDKKFAETDKKFTEMRESFAEMKENGRELKKHLDDVGAYIKEVTANINKTDVKLGGVSSRVEGIAQSNGMFAEEYFLNSLEEKMEFAGVHFDDIDDGFKRLMKMPDGRRLKDQFDIVMINDKAVAIIEIKYRARKDYLEEMVNRKVKNFRILFPDYEEFDIYLGLGAMAFDDDVLNEAEKYGIGILKQVGDVIEYKTDWVRVY